jgi:hypothetical protein
MAYIGLQPQRRTLGTSTQKLSGNGVDFEYTLNRGVSKAADLRVFVGATEMIPEVDYTATGTTLLFTSQPAAGTDNIVINYIAGALTTLNIEANSFPIGTTTNPSIRSIDAPSTGVYFPSTTTVGVTVSGNTRVTITDSPTPTNSSTGALRVQGGVGITDGLFTGGKITVENTTQAENTVTGAMIVAGGVGIAKDTFIGGALQVAGDFTVAGQFTTTGADSLAVNDPFIFLANANPGDNLDTGFISSYFDGSNDRYTGLFRDVTDGRYKLFNNLLIQPTTVVDTANVSYQAADLVVGNLTATTIFGTVAGGQTITEVGNLVNLSVSGTVSTYSTITAFSQTPATNTTSGALQVRGGVGVGGNVHAPFFHGNLVSTTVSATGITTGTLSASSGITGTLSTASQTNITSVGTLTSLAVGGTCSITSTLTINSTNQVTAIANGGTSGVGNIGASGATFNTIFARATTAQYADVAEQYYILAATMKLVNVM